MEALRELDPDAPPLTEPLPLARGVPVLGDAKLAAFSFFFFKDAPATGLINGDGRTLFARASAVVLRFFRILDDPLAIKASGEAVGVKLLLTAFTAGEPCNPGGCDACW